MRSIEAEKSALGSSLVSGVACARVTAELRVEDFTIEAHQLVFSAIKHLHDEGTAVDSVTVIDELDRAGHLAAVGGVIYITDLSLFVPSAANVEHYIKIIREHSRRRHLAEDLKRIVAGIQNGDEEDYIEQTEVALQNARTRTTSKVGMIGDYALEAFSEICEGRQRGLDTGFVILDQTIGGLNKGHVCVVAGRPSMGKTSFAANIAANASMNGKSVAFFSLEQPRKDIIKRMLISLSGCTEYDAHKGYSKPLAKLAESLDTVSKWNMCVVDDAYTLEKIRESCYSLKRKTKALDLIVIDYLGLIKTKGRKNGTREQEVSELSRNIKLLAREMDCPIILLSQLSRAPEQRTDHKPILADLRESGSIEQDADEVIFLYRPAVYNSTADGKEAIIHVAKNRNGATGGIKAKWDGEHFTYTDAEFEEVSAVKWEEL